MRFLWWLLGIPVGLVVVVFAVSNRAPVTFGLWPFSDGLAVPAYMASLVPLAAGLVLGAGAAGLVGLGRQMRVRGLRRRVEELERENALLKQERARPADPTSAAIAKQPALPPS